MTQIHKLTLYLVIFFATALMQFAVAESKLEDNLFLNCRQSTDKHLLRCDYRQIVPGPILSISAKSGNEVLTVREEFTYPRDGGITTILFLVDTSDPARQVVVQKNIEHIHHLLKSTSGSHHFGLASFDRDLQIEAPIGSPESQIITASQKLRATGKTTELYRNVLKAIKLLDNVDADRKSIFLFSDGLAEDQAYYNEDVVNAARKSGVVITGLGYPRSVSQSVALQTLRRLSEETGGTFIESDYQFNLPQGFLNQPYDSIDNGGQISIDLSPLFDAATSDNTFLNLIFETDRGEIKTSVPVSIPYTPKQIIKEIVTKQPEIQKVEQQTVIPPVKVVTIQSPKDKTLNTWFWYAIPTALLILVLLTFATFFLTLRRQGSKQQDSSSNQGTSEFKPYAYLVTQDETQKRYPITRSTWRIGRSKDNELILRDNSISRRHAEIHRDKGDVFTLVDLESLNGVFVNNEKIRKYRLREGDIVEIGDVGLRFTLLSDDYQLEESTVMQDTKVPITH